MPRVASAPPVLQDTPDAAAAPAHLVSDFERDGCAVWPGFWSAGDLSRARQQAAALLGAVDASAPTGVFSTLDHRHSDTAWFLGSADQIRPFFEEEAVDSEGRLLRPAAQAVNKFGHALHRLDPVFSALAADPRLRQLAQALGQAEPQWRQSMLIVKQPGIGGEVRWHQDATYLHSDPVSVLAFWWALEDAGVDNGCLWFEPGGHRGPLRERFVRYDDPACASDSARVGNTRHVAVDATPWPTTATAKPLPVAAGSLVLMHGLLPHRSDANRSTRSRLALSLHAVDAATPYALDNWLQSPGWPLGQRPPAATLAA